MMNRLIILLTAFAFFISCNNPLDVSITSELSDDIIQKENNKDSLFSGFYREVRFLVDDVYAKGEDVSYKGLTYKDLFEYHKYVDDRRKYLIDDGVYIEWQHIYKTDLEKFKQDSIKYAKYIDDNSYSKYVTLEPVRIYKERDWIESNTKVDITIKPIGDNVIRKIFGYVIIVNKGEDIDSIRYSTNRKEAFFSYNGAITGKYKLKASTAGIRDRLFDFIDIPIDIIQQKHDIYFDIHDLVIKDRYVDVKLESVPYEMQEYLKGGWRSSSFKDNYIVDHINKKYKYFHSFITDKIKANIPGKFKEKVEFYDKGYEKYHSELNKKYQSTTE